MLAMLLLWRNHRRPAEAAGERRKARMRARMAEYMATIAWRPVYHNTNTATIHVWMRRKIDSPYVLKGNNYISQYRCWSLKDYNNTRQYRYTSLKANNDTWQYWCWSLKANKNTWQYGYCSVKANNNTWQYWYWCLWFYYHGCILYITVLMLIFDGQ